MRGKPLTKDPAKIAEEENKDNLYKAIALIQQFAEGFSSITHEDLRTGGVSTLKQLAAESAEVSELTSAELFTRQFDKAKKSNPAVSRTAVAEVEEARASIMIEELEAIPGMKHYYKDHPLYVKVTSRETGYLKYLNDILNHVKGEKLRLADVLVPSATPEQVKEIYKNFLGHDKPSATALQTFLKHLADKGYYSCRLSNGDIQLIARSDFDPTFNYNTTKTRTPAKKGSELYNSFPYNKVPPVE